MDGRNSAAQRPDFVQRLQQKIRNWVSVRLATLVGRYYAMDRDQSVGAASNSPIAPLSRVKRNAHDDP